MTLTERIAGLFDLTGRSALVTGATGAFGAAAARALAGGGAHVTLAGGNVAALDALQAELLESGASTTVAAGRPDREESAAALVAAASAAGRGLDILVVASGTSVVKPALQLSATDWDKVMEANVRQSWLMAREAGRAMIGQERGGKIILVSSVRGTHASAAGTSAYGASKAAVDMLTRSFATEWGKHKINVNAVAPTIFRSELTAWLFADEAKERRDNALARIPLGRLAEPDDFAGSIVFLSSRASDYITGEVLHIDGGFSTG
jgi:NAD(P)-dependent dehydrogenase (short-subunit alcohol dehydrogenase family)